MAIDSQLASSAAISGVQEMLNGCICCNLVGQLGDALEELRKNVEPDRIIIETSGSAFPATLAMEVNRLAAESGNYSLDGVVVVIDVENWQGYEDTSYTAKMQARYTDLIVFNKWEGVDERRYEDCLDRVGDLEIEVATVKSAKGKVDREVLLGIDGAIAKDLSDLSNGHSGDAHEREHKHEHAHDHQEEVEVLSVTLSSDGASEPAVNLESLEKLLRAASKQEIYRIKGLLRASRAPVSSDGDATSNPVLDGHKSATYILNWAFGRWVFTPSTNAGHEPGIKDSSVLSEGVPVSENTKSQIVLRMTIILARGEANRWKKQIETRGYIETSEKDESARLEVRRLL